MDVAKMTFGLPHIGHSSIMIVRKIARPLLATVFVAQGIQSLLDTQKEAGSVAPTLKAMQSLPDPIANKVPTDAERVAQVTGATQVVGGLLLATGRVPRVAAALLAATVVPTSFGKHMFWAETDPVRKAQQRQAFLTDVSLLGGLLLASVDTAGKPSLGWRGRRAAENLLDALPSPGGSTQHEVVEKLAQTQQDVADKLGHVVQIGVERGRDLAETALERGAPLAELAYHRGADIAETAYQRGAEVAATAGKEGQARLASGWRKLREAADAG